MTTMTTDDAIASVSIDPRFCGPPASGNGGYVCGRTARFLEGPARVRLHVPPPLARPLSVHPAALGLELRDGDTRVASAVAAPLDLEPPPAPQFEDARAASRRSHDAAGRASRRTPRDERRRVAGRVNRRAAPFPPARA